MMLSEGQRVQVIGATGDRRRFEGRLGEVVKIQPRPSRNLEPNYWPHVRLDGNGRSHVFLPKELRVEGE